MMSQCVNRELDKLQDNRKSFLQSIKMEPDKERLRLLALKRKYDSGEISELDISDEDMMKIVDLYEEEIHNIKDETKRAKNKIKRMLEELKNN